MEILNRLKSLSFIEKIIYDNEDLFLNEFARGEHDQLLEVYFSSNAINLVYLLECGTTISDHIDVILFDKFLLKNNLDVVWE